MRRSPPASKLQRAPSRKKSSAPSNAAGGAGIGDAGAAVGGGCVGTAGDGDGAGVGSGRLVAGSAGVGSGRTVAGGASDVGSGMDVGDGSATGDSDTTRVGDATTEAGGAPPHDASRRARTRSTTVGRRRRGFIVMWLIENRAPGMERRAPKIKDDIDIVSRVNREPMTHI